MRMEPPPLRGPKSEPDYGPEGQRDFAQEADELFELPSTQETIDRINGFLREGDKFISEVMRIRLRQKMDAIGAILSALDDENLPMEHESKAEES